MYIISATQRMGCEKPLSYTHVRTVNANIGLAFDLRMDGDTLGLDTQYTLIVSYLRTPNTERRLNTKHTHICWEGIVYPENLKPL